MPLLRLLFPRAPLQWAGPILACGLMIGLFGLLFLIGGFIDLSASTPHPEGWAATLHYAFRRSIAHHADPKSVPADLDSPAMVMKGATYYATACGHCHGAPGLGQNPVALMMRPRPQYLPAVVDQFAPAELHYIVLHGVKYSGMPAWPAQSRPDEVWPIVAFLRAMRRTSYAQFRMLSRGDTPVQPTADPGLAFGTPGRLQRYALYAPDQPSDREHRYDRPVYGFDAFADSGDPRVTCAACHGADGAGRPGGAFPNLTIQTQTYLKDALTAFATGQRQSAYMQTVATQLSPGQIDALADYYGRIPARPLPAAGPVDPQTRAIGARIVGYGDKARGIGACSSCHGITRAVGKAVPRLEGQGAQYLIDQMRVFRSGGRGSSGSTNPMNRIARDLTDRQITAIATYYASTPPGVKAVQAARAVAAQ